MRFKLILIFLVCHLSVKCQGISTYGDVTDKESHAPIAGATVSLKDHRGFIVSSTSTTKEGTFKLTILKEYIGNLKLSVNCIGYQAVTVPLTDGQKYNITLEAKPFVIKEIYVRPQKIIHKSDTTSYLVSAFATKKDRTIGDVLRNMPGIDVNKDGQISYNGKAIDNFFIEGTDLFDGQYNIATRNISHDIISSIDVIENHQSAKVLRNSKSEGGTVLNLSLKDKAKGKWTGKLRMADGLPKLWESELFGANLSAKRQHAITLKTNNSGKDILSENKHMTLDEYINKNSGNELQPIMTISQPTPSILSEKRIRKGRTHLINIGSIKPIDSSTTLRTKLYYTDYRNATDHTENNSYFLSDSILTRSTREQNIVNNRELGVSALLKTDGEKCFFSDELKYSSLWQQSRNQITGDFNNQSNVHSDIHKVENHLQWIMPWKKNYLKFISKSQYTVMPEQIDILERLQKQQSITRYHFSSSTKLNYTYNIARFAIALEAEALASILNFRSQYHQTANDSTNNSSFNQNYLAGIIKAILTYKYHGKSLELQLPYSMYHYTHTDKANKIYCAPRLKAEWQFNAKWKAKAMITLGTREPMINSFFSIPVMTDYRTIHTRPTFIQSNNNRNAILGINYTDYQHMLFANINIGYYMNNNGLQMTKRINKDLIYYSWIKGENKIKMKILSGNISKQIEPIHGTANVRWDLIESKTAIYQNGNTMPYSTKASHTSIGLTSSPWSWLDINYNVDYYLNTLKLLYLKSSSKILKMNLEPSFYPVESLEITTKAEFNRYWLNNSKAQNSFFFDMDCTYRYRKFDFTLSITNLFNQKYYSNSIFNDISNSEERYLLRNRNILIGIVAYF